jgi:hypothetical protein
MFAYADDVDLMSRTMIGLKDSFHSFEKAAKCMGLVINQEKTMYMFSGKVQGAAKLLP